MTRKRRYLISAAVLAACVGIALGVLAMRPRPGVTKANFDRIEMGTTREEVESILGETSRGRASQLLGVDIIEFVDYRGEDGANAGIFFQDGIVIGNKTWTNSTEALPNRLRRWLRLPK